VAMAGMVMAVMATEVMVAMEATATEVSGSMS
jgi:hypothetical protein